MNAFKKWRRNSIRLKTATLALAMQSRNSKANCSAYTAKCTVILCVLEKYTSHLNSGAGGEERDFIKPGYKHLNPGDTIGHHVIVISRFYNKSHGNEK